MGNNVVNTRALEWLRGLDLNQRPSGYEHEQPILLNPQKQAISTLPASLLTKIKNIFNVKSNYSTTTLKRASVAAPVVQLREVK